MRLKEFLQKGGRKYNDPYYDQTDMIASKKVGVPIDILRAIRLAGEKSNENQVSSAGARGVYQFIPSVRNSVLKKYGVDAWNPNEASLAAAFLLKENADRNKGDYTAAVREYHGGIDRKNWGPVNRDYINRVNNFTGNDTTDVNFQTNYNPQYADMSQFKQVFEDMKSGLFNYEGLNQAYQTSPEFTEMMMSNINQSVDMAEKQRLDQERLQQEENKKMVEQENLQIQQALDLKKAEREQMLAMVPQLRSVTQGNISPQI